MRGGRGGRVLRRSATYCPQFQTPWSASPEAIPSSSVSNFPAANPEVHGLADSNQMALITSDRGRPSQEQPQPRCDKARLKLEGAGLRLVSHLSSLISLLCGPLEQRVQFCCPPPPMIKPDQVRPIHGGVEGEGGRDAYRLLVRVAIAIPTSAKERNPAQPRPPRKAISMEGAQGGRMRGGAS